MSLLSELKRRQVFRVGAAYLLTAWLVIQVVETILPAFGMGTDAVRVVTIGFAVGLIPTLIIAWIFELTPGGLRSHSVPVEGQIETTPAPRWLDRTLIVVLALAVGFLVFDKLVLSAPIPAPDQARPERADEVARGRSIAVLPFVNMSDDAGNEFFSDGISEELLNLLTGIRELRVISRSSAFSYKGREVRIGQIADELNVSHVLEGSVRKSGNRVRITAQLIDARTDTHLWSRTWDRELTDIFAVQDELAADVVSELKLTLLGAPRTPVTVPEAYELFLEARSLGRLATAESYAQAMALLLEVLALDPGYTPAWDGLAGVYLNQASKGLRPLDEGMALARQAAEEAIAIDPEFAPAHARLGWIALLRDNNLALAASHYQRALELEPGNDRIIGNATAVLKSLGRVQDCVVLDEWAAARDPLNPVSQFNLGGSYLYANRPADAITVYRTALRLSPDRIGAWYHMGMAHLLEGDPLAALDAMQREPLAVLRQTGEVMAYHALGETGEADRVQQDLIEQHSQDAAYNIAYALAYRGDVNGAFFWLDLAKNQHDPGLTDIAVEPMFGNIRDDPRWLPFLESVGRSPAQLAAIGFEVKIPVGS